MTLKPKPLVFTGPMVRAIMAGLKTNSRRIMRVQPKYCQLLRDGRLECSEDGGFDWDVTYIKPPHQPGDIVYVAEGYQAVDYNSIITRIFWFYYSADQMKSLRKATLTDAEWEKFINRKGNPFKKLAGRFMYRSLARTYLEILSVKAERIKSISDADVKAEGIEGDILGQDIGMRHEDTHSAGCYFMDLWNSIHGPDAWDRNDWVWAYTFKRREKPE